MPIPLIQPSRKHGTVRWTTLEISLIAISILLALLALSVELNSWINPTIAPAAALEPAATTTDASNLTPSEAASSTASVPSEGALSTDLARSEAVLSDSTAATKRPVLRGGKSRIEISESASLSSAMPGQVISYTLGIVSNSDTPQSIQVRASVDGPIEITDLATSNGTCSSSNPAVCNVSARKGKPAAMVVTVRVRESAVVGNRIVSQALAQDDNKDIASSKQVFVDIVTPPQPTDVQPPTTAPQATATPQQAPPPQVPATQQPVVITQQAQVSVQKKDNTAQQSKTATPEANPQPAVTAVSNEYPAPQNATSSDGYPSPESNPQPVTATVPESNPQPATATATVPESAPPPAAATPTVTATVPENEPPPETVIPTVLQTTATEQAIVALQATSLPPVTRRIPATAILPTAVPISPQVTVPQQSAPLPSTAATAPTFSLAGALFGLALTIHATRRIRSAHTEFSHQEVGVDRMAPIVRAITYLQHSTTAEMERMENQNQQLTELLKEHQDEE